MAIADIIGNKKEVYIINENGHINRQKSNGAYEEKMPLPYKYPQMPEINKSDLIMYRINDDVIWKDSSDGKMTTYFHECDEVDRKNEIMLSTWKECRKKRLMHIRHKYRMQQTKLFLKKINPLRFIFSQNARQKN